MVMIYNASQIRPYFINNRFYASKNKISVVLNLCEIGLFLYITINYGLKFGENNHKSWKLSGFLYFEICIYFNLITIRYFKHFKIKSRNVHSF